MKKGEPFRVHISFEFQNNNPSPFICLVSKTGLLRKSACLLTFLLLCACIVSPLIGCGKKYFSNQKPSIKNSRSECVILLHGMGRTYHSMDDMQEAVTEAGYHTVNLDYPSTQKDIVSIAREHLPLALNQCEQFNPTVIHFVTHSLGGIVIRKALLENRPAKLGRVVMLSPPNQGSVVAETLKNWWFYAWLNGPAGQQLSTTPDSVPNQLAQVDYPVGIITGDRHTFFDAWFSHLIPGEDDGKVSVKRAKVDNMSDFLVVHQSHPFIMNSNYVQAEAVHFLNHGIFKHQKDPLPPVPGADWFSFASQ